MIQVEWGTFISYSHVDEWFVQPFTDVIRIFDGKTFRDKDSIPKGKKWEGVITAALKQCTRMFVFWSTAAASSKSVADEYQTAIEQRTTGDVPDLIPVLLDDSPLPENLKPYQCIDFRDIWKRNLQKTAADRHNEGGGNDFLAGGLCGFLIGYMLPPVVNVGINAITIGGGPVGAIIGGLAGAILGPKLRRAGRRQPSSPQTYQLSEDDKALMLARIKARFDNPAR